MQHEADDGHHEHQLGTERALGDPGTPESGGDMEGRGEDDGEVPGEQDEREPRDVVPEDPEHNPAGNRSNRSAKWNGRIVS